MEGTALILFGVFLRWCVSLYPYSGAGKPPLFGDYEAQRHWQEITTNVPVREWYRNGTENDLLYWGLDYPPLTAYHSFLCGLIANLFDPGFVKLHESRGYESKEHKLFMRSSVLLVDIFIFFPAVYLLYQKISQKTSIRKNMAVVLILYPGLMLIDYGHFQYNNMSLGLFIFSVAFLLGKKDVVASVFFCLALNYKQMELYHALPIFCYLLGNCLKQKTYRRCAIKLAKIATAVIVTFLICWLPFLFSRQSLIDVLTRVFPINRGLYEDKVANFWCSINIFIKFRSIISVSKLAVICLAATVTFSLPSCIHLLLKPTHQNLKYALFNVAMAFFMFSFHVHEKSILLAAFPAIFLFDVHPMAVFWFLQVSTLSMFPLFVKDDIIIPGLTLLLIFHSIYHAFLDNFEKDRLMDFVNKLAQFSIMLLYVLCLLSLCIPPPDRYPHLFEVLISILCFIKFFNFYVYFNYCQYGSHFMNELEDKFD